MSPSSVEDAEGVGIEEGRRADQHRGQADQEWNAATSCGIAVIWMRRAVIRPITAPMAIARGSRRASPGLEVGRAPPVLVGIGAWVTSVVTTAIAMPTMPKRLPRWLVAGHDSPRSARMKQTPATR